jgi:arsenate reductase-like glutaredoxin family protein
VIDPSQPLAHVGTVEALNAEHKQAKEVIRAAEAMLDEFESGTDSVEYQGTSYTKAQVKQILRNAKVTIEDLIPQRYQFLQGRDGWRAKAYEEFPFLKDRTTKEYQMVEQARRNYPIIANLPDADYVLGLAVEGIKAVEARKAAAAKTAPKPASKAPASQVATSATGSRSRVADDTVQRQQVGREVAAIKSQKRNLSTNDVTSILLKQSTLRTR